MGRVIGYDQIGAVAEEIRAGGRKIVLTNGCFDLIHLGHLRSLQAAKDLAEVLMVGVNADAQVRELKGAGRPFLPEEERVELVAGLVPVDYAFIFAERTAAGLLRAIRPDIYAKGGDYNPGNLPEGETARDLAVKVVFLPMFPGRSTSALAEAIQNTRPAKKEE